MLVDTSYCESLFSDTQEILRKCFFYDGDFFLPW